MSCQPVLNGILWNLGNSIFYGKTPDGELQKQFWKDEFDALEKLHLETVMIFTGLPQAWEKTGGDHADDIELMYQECDRRNMKLIISTGTTPQWYHNMQMPDESLKQQKWVEEIFRRYGHHASFAGWYIDYEFSVTEGKLGEMLFDLFRDIVGYCKEKTPDLPVVASPFFIPPTATSIMHPGHPDPQIYYTYWSKLIAYSKVDVISLQDTGAQHLSFFDTDTTEPYIAAVAQACKENNCRFWGNVETGEFEIESAEAFTEKFGPDGNVNRPGNASFWRPVPISRLQKKLELMSKYSEYNLSWGYQAFYRPALGGKALEAYNNYANYLQKFK